MPDYNTPTFSGNHSSSPRVVLHPEAEQPVAPPSELEREAAAWRFCAERNRWPKMLLSGGYKGAYTESWVFGENPSPKGYQPQFNDPLEAVESAMQAAAHSSKTEDR
jgi:hypothetical protein